MRNWIKRTLIGLFGAAALSGGLAACSHRMHGGGYGWHAASEEDAARFKARMVERIGERLQLDEVQKGKLGTLADKLREQRLALMGSGTDPRAEVQALVAGPAFDRNGAQNLLAGKIAAVNGKSPEVIAAMADFFDSLRPEQQQKVREFMQRGRGGWHRD
jgi:periplasmic protein CpxP/Spy